MMVGCCLHLRHLGCAFVCIGPHFLCLLGGDPRALLWWRGRGEAAAGDAHAIAAFAGDGCVVDFGAQAIKELFA